MLSAAFLTLVGFGAISNAMAQESVTPAPNSNDKPFSPADKNGRFVYLIEFAEPGLLNRPGSAVGKGLQPNSREIQAQRDLMVAEQAAHVQAMNAAVGRSLAVTHHFLATHSGVATRMTPAEAERVRRVAGVKSVTRERVDQLDP